MNLTEKYTGCQFRRYSTKPRGEAMVCDTDITRYIARDGGAFGQAVPVPFTFSLDINGAEYCFCKKHYNQVKKSETGYPRFGLINDGILPERFADKPDDTGALCGWTKNLDGTPIEKKKGGRGPNKKKVKKTLVPLDDKDKQIADLHLEVDELKAMLNDLQAENTLLKQGLKGGVVDEVLEQLEEDGEMECLDTAQVSVSDRVDAIEGQEPEPESESESEDGELECPDTSYLAYGWTRPEEPEYPNDLASRLCTEAEAVSKEICLEIVEGMLEGLEVKEPPFQSAKEWKEYFQANNMEIPKIVRGGVKGWEALWIKQNE